MNPCMLTSRVRQAIGAVQTFFQRCLMNLEPQGAAARHRRQRLEVAEELPSLGGERERSSCILRTGSSRSCATTSRRCSRCSSARSSSRRSRTTTSRRRSPTTSKGSTRSRVSTCAACGSKSGRRTGWSHGQTPKRAPHPASRRGRSGITARITSSRAPSTRRYVWYYRRLENGRDWTPWEKIDADIEGEHLVPVVFQRRMHLFWTMFREVQQAAPEAGPRDQGPAADRSARTGRSSSPTRSTTAAAGRGSGCRRAASIDDAVVHPDRAKVDRSCRSTAAACLSPSDYTLRATMSDKGDLPQLHLHLYRRASRRRHPPTTDHTLAPRRRRADRALRAERLQRRAGARIARKAVRAPVVQAARPRRGKRGAVNAAIGNVRRARAASHAVPHRRWRHRQRAGRLSRRRHGVRRARPVGAGRCWRCPAADAARPRRRARGTAARTPRRQCRSCRSINPTKPEQRGLYPFFFQDRFRSYFVRPIYTDWRPPPPVAVPLVRRRRAPARARAEAGPATAAGPARASRRRARPTRGDRRTCRLGLRGAGRLGGSGGRGLAPRRCRRGAASASDARARRHVRGRSRRTRRRRTGGRARAGRCAHRKRRRAPAVRAAASRAATTNSDCSSRRSSIPTRAGSSSTLKAKGIEGLLDFSTTRPRAGPRPRAAARRHLGPPATDLVPAALRRRPARLHAQPAAPRRRASRCDIPYGVYNWELFFHAPLQVAVRLAKDGRHEEAQRWFHFIFDPTTDSSAPSPKRYWRFAPFYENNEYDSARELMHLLSYTGRGQRSSSSARTRSAVSCRPGGRSRSRRT